MDEFFESAREHPYLAVLGASAGIMLSTWLLHRFFPAKSNERALDTEEFREFPLIEKRVISHNTALYRFKLPTSDSVLGLPVGQHISVRATINGKQITRSYTPTSSDDDRGHFDLLVKSYEQGNVSKYFAQLKIGDKIEVRGPKGAFKYQPNMVKHLGMIAGGTGITPMYQIARAILKNPEDKTQVSLIFANVNEEDILLREELDEMAAKHSNFSVYYVLNNPPEGWTGGVGFVTEEMIRKYCPKPAGGDSKILLCGPPPMIKAMSAHCEAIGFARPRVVSKMEDEVFKF